MENVGRWVFVRVLHKEFNPAEHRSQNIDDTGWLMSGSIYCILCVIYTNRPMISWCKKLCREHNNATNQATAGKQRCIQTHSQYYQSATTWCTYHPPLCPDCQRNPRGVVRFHITWNIYLFRDWLWRQRPQRAVRCAARTKRTNTLEKPVKNSLSLSHMRHIRDCRRQQQKIAVTWKRQMTVSYTGTLRKVPERWN